jgi:hypothetical protein
MAFPIRLLWNLRISKIQKVGISIAFCVGILTMVCAIVRTSSLGVAANAGQIPISWLVLWAAIEGLVGTYRILISSPSTPLSPCRPPLCHSLIFPCSPRPLYTARQRHQRIVRLKQIFPSLAIVVNCLPAFAVFMRAQVGRTRAGTYASAGAYAAQASDSKTKSRKGGDSMLLSDMGLPEAGGRGVPRSSPEDSDAWTHAGSESKIRVGL